MGLKLQCLVVSIVGGMVFGFGIGFVPIYSTLFTLSRNCTHFDGEDACHSVQQSQCVWTNTSRTNYTPRCEFKDLVDCGAAHGEANCTAVHGCFFDFSSKVCTHSAGWDAVEMGVFAGAMIVGGTIGSMTAHWIADTVGRKKTFALIATVGLISTALFTIAHVKDVYWLLIVSRITYGLACGTVTVVIPLYVGEMAPEGYREPIGYCLQIFICFGIMWVALLGIILKPRNFVENLKFEMRFELLFLSQWLLSFMLLPIAAWLPESVHWEEEVRDRGGDERERIVSDKPEDGQTHDNEPLPFQSLAVGFVLALCLQFTGINACMNYAPSITSAAGFTPLVGNFIVMAWNFLATIASIPLSKKAKPHTLFLCGTLVSSLACFLVGIVTIPSVVENETAKHVLSAIGIIVFIGAFEMGMGGSFYLLAQGAHPKHFRSKGTSFTVMAQFALNIIINVVFPIAVVSISGGPSKDQNKGLSATFLFFGSCGLFGFLFLSRTLKRATNQNSQHNDEYPPIS